MHVIFHPKNLLHFKWPLVAAKAKIFLSKYLPLWQKMDIFTDYLDSRGALRLTELVRKSKVCSTTLYWRAKVPHWPQSQLDVLRCHQLFVWPNSPLFGVACQCDTCITSAMLQFFSRCWCHCGLCRVCGILSHQAHLMSVVNILPRVPNPPAN